MKSTRDGAAFVIPPALLAEVEAVAQESHRAVDEVLRDIIERALSERRLNAMTVLENERVHAGGLHTTMTEEYRQSLRGKIAEGLQSLRDGKATDGETVMTKMDAELAELERQGL